MSAPLAESFFSHLTSLYIGYFPWSCMSVETGCNSFEINVLEGEHTGFTFMSGSFSLGWERFGFVCFIGAVMVEVLNFCFPVTPD